jgi:pimeloyl-ACP methyl ester carboxylesterase
MAELAPIYRIVAMQARPMWKNSNPNDFGSWENAADDLIQFLDGQQLTDIIGMGHSFGAICTLIAAQKRPELFSKLVLIEPVVLPTWYYLFNSLTPQFVLKKINPVVKKTLVRKELWPDRNEAFKHFRRSRLFALVPDDSLWDYVNSATVENENGAKLTYSKEWEAQVFLTVIDPWLTLKKTHHPTLIIKGDTSDTIFPQVWNKLKATVRNATFVEMKACGHLVPLEKPEEVAALALHFLHSDR